MSSFISIVHHGAVTGVTGSCHRLVVRGELSSVDYLIDCGLFQGAELTALSDNNSNDRLAINFDISNVKALIVTHCHIDHVGRIPYLLAAGFSGSIYCSKPTAYLLPEVIEDAVKVGVSRSPSILKAVLRRLKQQLVAVEYNEWQLLTADREQGADKLTVKVKFSPAGHILGSAYVSFDCWRAKEKQRVIFSGDLGACHSPLLAAPKPPFGCNKLIIESTYGDKNHSSRKERRQLLHQVLRKCVVDNGVVLIPAFSIGRTQELLYEIEQILHQIVHSKHNGASDNLLSHIDVILDSPLAAKFTQHYRTLSGYWDKEARRKLNDGRHPLAFEQLTTIDSNAQHLSVINYLKSRKLPAIVIAASGMCTGGRIVNYLKAFIEQPTTDILFSGYQAKGTTGSVIQRFGPANGFVELDNKRYNINAGVYTLSGYSAHADQKDLLRFVSRMRNPPEEIVIVHGDDEAKQALKAKLRGLLPRCEVRVGKGWKQERGARNEADFLVSVTVLVLGSYDNYAQYAGGGLPQKHGGMTCMDALMPQCQDGKERWRCIFNSSDCSYFNGAQYAGSYLVR